MKNLWVLGLLVAALAIVVSGVPPRSENPRRRWMPWSPRAGGHVRNQPRRTDHHARRQPINFRGLPEFRRTADAALPNRRQEDIGLERRRRMGIELSGPHVCQEKGSKFCCSGWVLDKDGKCTQAKCEEGACGAGNCEMPNLCLCPDLNYKRRCLPRHHYASVSGSSSSSSSMNCRCQNGGRCIADECHCRYGYTGPHCQQAICGPGCLNGGDCITPGRCQCVYGFTGMRCERDYRKGPCFLTRTNSTCTNEVQNVMCTKLFCCATVGEGWGHPCEECPARVGNCSKGRLPPHCTDINECEIMPGLCEGGECVNTDGSFTCNCPQGYKYDTTMHRCVDVDECRSSSVCTDGTCINEDGGFRCECAEDYQLSDDGFHCISNRPGRCYTAIESGMCANPLGNLVRRTMCCCMQSGQETLGKCFAAVGQFAERCAAIGTPEYQQQCPEQSESNICEVLDEQACANGRCVPLLEQHSYACECNAGYHQSVDRQRCIDDDECTDVGAGDICGSYGTCLNTDGSYRCYCHHGFENAPDSQTSCVDIDECSQGDLCDNGHCVNTRGSFICSCHSGYRVSPTQQNCNDIDECVENQGLCEHGRCINIDGFYKCLCHPGYYLSADGTECLDENECERNNMCTNGECVNMDGRYKCVCHDGFRLLPSGDSCGDIDECLHNPCVNGICENSMGSFSCHCHRFQVLDESGTRCVLDLTDGECFRSVRNGQCRAHNALHLATTRADCCCSVPGATSAWGSTCEPCAEEGDADYAVLCANYRVQNKCELLENPCVNGHCVNMGNNAFRCECNTGFLVADDQQSCIDFDECTQNLCSNGICRNTPGSYMCTCNVGFVLSGDVCEDVDECLSNPCTNARCVNEPGTYRCVCEDGAMLDVTKHVCYDVRVGRCWLEFNGGQCQGSIGDRLMTAEQCCNSMGAAWGHGTECLDCATLAAGFRCDEGFKLDITTDQCVDIKECDLGYCQEGAECIETIGSFRCVCPPGFTLSADGTSCADLRVGYCYLNLEDNTCTPAATDNSKITKAKCCCSVGQAWGDECETCPTIGTEEFVNLCQKGDLAVFPGMNECILFPHLCINGVCKNTDSSFMCQCNRGFTLDEGGKNCSDINECQISPGLCGNGVCENVDGDFQCVCDEGYQPSLSMKVCVDVDECTMPGYCTGGDCINTEGSYQCTCQEGRSLSSDGTNCVDIDECALKPDLCEPNGRCENMLGYYMCLCDIGYSATADAQDCVDIDECEVNNGGCHMGCTNTIGSYECTCEDGFVLTFDGHTCADKDECMEQMNRCGGGQCENTNGAFRCVCFDGFMATNDLQFCEDIDECAMNPNACMHGRCHNTRGSYTCQCDDGYCVPQGQMICVDEDECEMSKHNCHVNADCNNTDGSYTCQCIAGFNGDGFMCHDDNECETGTHLCHDQATCRNKLGTYTCDCNEGYHGDGFTCSDNDDCLEDTTLCGANGQCINIAGSFQCECSMGFAPTEDLKACKDIDECSFDHVCVNGRCHNVPGDFACVCLNGYEKDEQGGNCTDIDECAEVAKCINGICVNTQGSYECQCPEGFEPNPTGIGCVDNRIGDCYLNSEGDENAPICTDRVGASVTKSRCCCSKAEGWGNPCEVCPLPGTPEYDMLCPGGYGFVPNPITVLLEDIDECVQLPGLCQGGKCINVFGSYICNCNEGFILNEDSHVCEDVNECEHDVCGAGTCLNTVGGYNCACPEGYKSILGGRKCEDIREASCHRYYNVTADACTSELTFETTKKTCCCFPDIGEGWNNPCEPCPLPSTPEFLALCGTENYTLPENICATGVCKDGECIQTVDGYRCECMKGYHYNQDLIICEDDDECVDEDLCFADADCSNTPGSYLCSCRQGFVFNEATDQCEDIDECLLASTCANGDCQNTHGGFVCDCNQGFTDVNEGKACEDVNECDRNPCGRGKCMNVFGSFSCACDTGFRISNNGDCIDINECDEEGQCKNGVCDNLPGGFVCACDDGYDVTPDGRICIDSNECQLDSTICGVGTCQNMDGSYKCYCPDGYESLDGKSCTDIDECQDAKAMCKFGRCTNTEGSYECDCDSGFVLSRNGKMCIDTRLEKCFATVVNGVCDDPGSSVVRRDDCCCRCTGGGWGTDDQCQPCPAINSTEFADLCPNGCGYGSIESDINECIANDPCINAKCVNLAGSFKCVCSKGFELDVTNRRCIDIDECLNGSPCGHGTCQNTEGSFECECDEGYYNGPDIACHDIDECADDRINECAFRCENTDGSFHCACPSGFQLRPDGNMCEDIDECVSDLHNDCATKGMECKNIIGYYICLCRSGYRRVGTSDTCVDVNECDQLRVCTNGVCINQDGTYECQCNEGYEYDAEHKMCLDTRQGECYTAVHQRMCEVTSTTGLPFTKAECCCGKGKGWGADCEECPHPGTAAFLLLCPHGPGYQPNGDDIDDCRVLPGLCNHGTCINTLGSFRCACSHGYEPSISKQVCLDINECLSTPNPCSFDCRNTEGSFECVCPKGYQVDGDSVSCVDVDECATKRHNCQYLCLNTVGSFKCECPHGFVREGAQCVDKNECVDMPGVCGPRGICRNDPGSYHCECPRGFRRGNMGEECMDVDECGSGQVGCAGNCQNIPGSFRCLCSRGFTSTLYGRGCQDVDECVHSPCSQGQLCSNTRGGFQCGCSSGLRKVNGGCMDIDECQMGGGSCNFGCRNTFGGFSCSCPRGFFRLGSGHCMNAGGQGGFRQRIPQYNQFNPYGPPPMFGPPQAQDPYQQRRNTVCYNCMPGGDTGRRSKRSASEGQFIEKHDMAGLASVNETYPIEIYLRSDNVTHHTPLLNLRPSLKQLRRHSRYSIISGNEDRRFRMHHTDQTTFLHFAKHAADAVDRVLVEAGIYTLRLKAKSTLSEADISKMSLESELIGQALASQVVLEVKVHVEDP
uniref:Fibrillin-2 n=1 Tax=Phallusia mammillata TaxID=59560 RepID=A0A6F9DC04_9ASCI|nr:fibrillin-2 [Phallusia mammillata]